MKSPVLSALLLVLMLGALIGLGFAFISLPNGWNLIPLFLMALLFMMLAARCPVLALTPPAPEAQPADTSPAAGTEATDTPNAVRPRRPFPEWAGRLNRAFGPILAGLVIDLVDLATFGPIGLVLGLPLGGLAGYWMAHCLGLSRRASLWCALAAGIYCTIPGTEVVPLATLVGAMARFQQGGKPNPGEQPTAGGGGEDQTPKV